MRGQYHLHGTVLHLRVELESTARLQVEFIQTPECVVSPHHHHTSCSIRMFVNQGFFSRGSLHLALSGMWNCPDLYISSTEGKFSGFLSKKYSGGLPGTYSSHRLRISSTLSVFISLPSLVLGYLMKWSLHPWNLSPPTSSITYCLKPSKSHVST